MQLINQRGDEIFILELLQTAIKRGSEKKVFRKSGQSLRNNYEEFDFSVKMHARILQLYEEETSVHVLLKNLLTF